MKLDPTILHQSPLERLEASTIAIGEVLLVKYISTTIKATLEIQLIQNLMVLFKDDFTRCVNIVNVLQKYSKSFGDTSVQYFKYILETVKYHLNESV